MKFSFRFYHFLGGIKFAIILIAVTAIFVAVGTLLESLTDSHLFSASLTYNSPIFKALIWGFFLNILISALRRWPFKMRHIPFLITHLGLLIMITGIIVKSYIGVQGSMSVLEGGFSNRLFLSNTLSVHLEKKDPANPFKKIRLSYPFAKIAKQNIKFDDVEMRIADFGEHSYESFQTWVKDDYAIINASKSIALSQNLLDKSLHSLHHESSTPWNVIAVKNEDAKEISEKIYTENATLQISDTDSKRVIAKHSLIDLLNNNIKINGNVIHAELKWNYIENGLDNPFLKIFINEIDIVEIPLQGENSLLNKVSSNNYLGKHFFTFDIILSPTLLIVEDLYRDNHLFAFNCHGEIYNSILKKDDLHSLYSYDDGFGGYKIHTEIPFLDLPCGRVEKELVINTRIAGSLRSALLNDQRLSNPLHVIKNATDKLSLDFSESLLKLLISWNEKQTLLMDGVYDEQIHKIAHAINWNEISEQERNACGWLCVFLDELSSQREDRMSLHEFLELKGWPLASHFEDGYNKPLDQMVVLFAQQLFSAADELPPPRISPDNNSLKGLSAYLLAYGVTLNSIQNTSIADISSIKALHANRLFYENVFLTLKTTHKNIFNDLLNLSFNDPVLSKIKMHFHTLKKSLDENLINEPTLEDVYLALNASKPLDVELLTADEHKSIQKNLQAGFIKLETPLSLLQGKLPSLRKWEDNHPFLKIELKKGALKEYATLTYDKYGTGLAWPVLDGQYLVRFQPEFREIPYKVRLHSARQINYPGSSQPFSYEADIIVTNLNSGKVEEKTISMNNVYETDDGYRFYLSSLSPGDESTTQRVQIVVNHDPAKYYLTYTGAFLVSMGIISLFWMHFFNKIIKPKS